MWKMERNNKQQTNFITGFCVKAFKGITNGGFYIFITLGILPFGT